MLAGKPLFAQEIDSDMYAAIDGLADQAGPAGQTLQRSHEKSPCGPGQSGCINELKTASKSSKFKI